MNTKEGVKKLLIDYPLLKDSDNRLIANYWAQELNKKGLDPKEMNGEDILLMYAKSKLTNTETIRRMRAKLQEECPELRGKAYELRMGKKQKQWRIELGYEVDK